MNDHAPHQPGGLFLIQAEELRRIVEKTVSSALQQALEAAEPNSNALESPIMTQREAEQYSSLSRSTLLRLRQAGDIKFVQVGRNIRYRKADIDSYLASKTRRCSN